MGIQNANIVLTETLDPVDPVGIAAVTGVYTMNDVSTERTGYCSTWGQHHYHTFDGKMYRFQGDGCSYTLMEDSDYLISVKVHNSENCVDITCRRSVRYLLSYHTSRMIEE